MARSKSAATTATEQLKEERIEVKKIGQGVIKVKIRGTAPYVQNKFSGKAAAMMKEAQEAGEKKKKGKARTPKDFQQCYLDSMHTSHAGWHGIPATAFRNAMIDTCRVTGIQMTIAKRCLFVRADGYDKDDSSPLVKITKGKPHYYEASVRLATGVCDLRARAMWDAGWEAVLVVEFNSNIFDASSVVNLLSQAGYSDGIGEGRPGSKMSNGVMFGRFEVDED